MSLLKFYLISSLIYSILAQPVYFRDSGEAAKSSSVIQAQAELQWPWEEALIQLLLCRGPGSGPKPIVATLFPCQALRVQTLL